MSSPAIVRLQLASLCVDCEAITESDGTVCVACGHTALISLARVLGTIAPDEAARVVDAGVINFRNLLDRHRDRTSNPEPAATIRAAETANHDR